MEVTIFIVIKEKGSYVTLARMSRWPWMCILHDLMMMNSYDRNVFLTASFILVPSIINT